MMSRDRRARRSRCRPLLLMAVAALLATLPGVAAGLPPDRLETLQAEAPTLNPEVLRLGRSWGCPAVTRTVARPLIDEIKGGNYLFIYYPDDHWLSASVYLNGCSAEVSRAVSGEQ